MTTPADSVSIRIDRLAARIDALEAENEDLAERIGRVTDRLDVAAIALQRPERLAEVRALRDQVSST